MAEFVGHPTYQPKSVWPHGYETLETQHGSMDDGAIFHTTASYNCESRTEQEAMLAAAIVLSVAESVIRCTTKTSTPPEC